MDTLHAAYLICVAVHLAFCCMCSSRDLNENLTEKSERPPHLYLLAQVPPCALA